MIIFARFHLNCHKQSHYGLKKINIGVDLYLSFSWASVQKLLVYIVVSTFNFLVNQKPIFWSCDVTLNSYWCMVLCPAHEKVILLIYMSIIYASQSNRYALVYHSAFNLHFSCYYCHKKNHSMTLQNMLFWHDYFFISGRVFQSPIGPWTLEGSWSLL